MAKPKVPFARGRHTCVFCGKFGSSEEHVFPDWLREIYPRDPSTTHTFGTINPSNIINVPSVIEYKRQGHVGTKVIKNVCKDCNTGWMSTLEDENKAILKPLILGERVNLTPERQLVLATWAAKTAMTAEQLRPHVNGIRQDERTWLMSTLSPPKNWLVWILSYKGGRWSNLTFTQKRGNLQFAPIRQPGIKPDYIQASTWAMGRIGFLVISTSADAVPKAFGHYDGKGLSRIWSPVPRSLIFPMLDKLTDSNMNDVADVLTVSGVLNNSLNRLANYRTNF